MGEKTREREREREGERKKESQRKYARGEMMGACIHHNTDKKKSCKYRFENLYLVNLDLVRSP